MASITATATRAAAGFDKRASTASSLQTPGSGSFPSEGLSPMAPSPSYLKRDELRTPITPPSAYLDFLNKMSPAVMSPAPTSAAMSPALTGNSSHFNFGSRSFDKSSEPPSTSISPPQTAPLPSLSRNTSYDSQTSNASNASSVSQHSIASTSQASSIGTKRSKPESPRVIIPPSPFARPGPPSSARAPRLRIPQSPFTPALNTSQSVPSPYSSTPVSAAPWSASFSPREPAAEGSNTNNKVSVRQVVTRTVTYCRTPLDPAPKGKRRKIEVEEIDAKSSSEEPRIKEEKSDEEGSDIDAATPPAEQAVPATLSPPVDQPNTTVLPQPGDQPSI